MEELRGMDNIPWQIIYFLHLESWVTGRHQWELIIGTLNLNPPIPWWKIPEPTGGVWKSDNFSLKFSRIKIMRNPLGVLEQSQGWKLGRCNGGSEQGKGKSSITSPGAFPNGKSHPGTFLARFLAGPSWSGVVNWQGRPGAFCVSLEPVAAVAATTTVPYEQLLSAPACHWRPPLLLNMWLKEPGLWAKGKLFTGNYLIRTRSKGPLLPLSGRLIPEQLQMTGII